MVEIVVVGIVNRVPVDDDGGAFESVGEVGGGGGVIEARSVGVSAGGLAAFSASRGEQPLLLQAITQ